MATPSVVVYFNIRQLEFHQITILTRFVILILCFETVTFVVGGLVGWSFIFFVAPSLAVFNSASVFNQDVSKWNTGAVTIMQGSKCTCTLSPSLPLCGHAFRFVVYLNTTTRISSDHNSHVLLFCFVLLKRYLYIFIVVCGGLVFLFLVALSLLQCFITQKRSTRTCPNGTCLELAKREV